MQQNSTQENPEQREINIEEILQVILRRKSWIILIILFSLVISIINYFTKTPDYHANAVLMINQAQGAGEMIDAMLSGGAAADSKVAQKDVELLESIPIAELTVRRLWQSNHRDSLELFDRKPFISPARRFLSWLIPVRGNYLNSADIVPGTPLYESTMRMYALKLKNRIRVLNSMNTSILQVSVGSPFADEAVLLTNTLCEEYKKSDIQRNSERYVQSNRFVAEMLKDQEKQLVIADRALSEFMIANKIYEVTGNTGMLLGKLVELDSRYRDVLAEYHIILNNRNFIDKKLSDADREMSNRVSRVVNVQLGSIQDDIRSRESAYIRTLNELGADAEKVKEMKKQLDLTKERYDQISNSQIAGQIGYIGNKKKYSYDLVSERLQLEQKLNNIKYSADEYKKLKNYYDAQLSNLPDKEQSFVRLMRDREVVSKTYLYLKEKLDESRILIGSEVGSVTTIGSAFRPFQPESPDMRRNILMGLVIGLVISLLYVVAAEMLDDRINYDPLFFKSLGFNIWGIVPLIPSFNAAAEVGFVDTLRNKLVSSIKVIFKRKVNIGNQSIAKLSAPAPVANSYPMMTDKLNSSFAESFRTLRTNLAFARIDRPMKKIIISGCSMGEGKSTVCANMAISWAIADKKTLIIDADLRRPSQHRIFQKSRAIGLADCLVNNDLEMNDRYIHKTHLENLFLMSAGSPVPNPNELLGSDRMRGLLENLSQKYEHLIIDSPPVFISDAAQFLGMIDGVLIAVRLGYSSKFTLRQYAYDSFINPHVVGIVLIDNERPTKGLIDQGYGRYGYSRYGYGDYSDSDSKQ